MEIFKINLGACFPETRWVISASYPHLHVGILLDVGEMTFKHHALNHV